MTSIVRSDPVISTLKSIFCFIKTDIPELYKPWTSTSSNHSTLIGAPLFIVISRHGVVFYHDDNKGGLPYYRQTPIQRKVHTISCGFLTDGEEDQLSNSEMEAKDAEFKSTAGLAQMNVYDPEKQSTKFDNILLVADTALQCIKYVPNISCLWRSTRETFSIYKLNLVFDHEQKGADFFPFSLKTGVLSEYQLTATNPVSSKINLIELSQSYKDEIVLSHHNSRKDLSPSRLRSLERQILLHR